MKTKTLISVLLIIIIIVSFTIIQISDLDLKPEQQKIYKSVHLNNS